MALYRAHMGEEAIGVVAAPEGLDVTASRTGDRLFLHVVNTLMKEPVNVQLDIRGATIRRAVTFEIAGDPFAEIDEFAPDIFNPDSRKLETGAAWRVPSASVSAIEIDIDDES